MDGGDQLGQLIVANLEALPKRSTEESALLFEAQKARAKLYQESSGATALEAAESLIAASETLQELNHDAEALASLLEPARETFSDLVAIGSKRNAWLCLEIIISCLRVTKESKEITSQALRDFADFSRDMIHDGREPGLLGVILGHCDWAREAAPDQFPELVNLVPLLLEQRTNDLPWRDVLRAYLYARHLSLGFGGKTLENIARKMAGLGMCDAEVRVVYQDFLCEAVETKSCMEDVFKDLAYVNPSPDIAYDADLDSLNGLLAEHFPECEWVWRNRALLSRRHGDRAGALVNLSRAMSIDGEPPVVMGLLAPVLAGMGFLQSAFHFARFAPKETSERFELGVLKLLAAEPSSKIGCERLQRRLEESILRENLPIEFRPLIVRRRAELLFRCGEFDQARGLYTEIFRDNLSDEIAAVRLAEIAFTEGDETKVVNYLSARFTDRVIPFVEHIRSRLAERKGDLDKAWQHNERALDTLPAAQSAGRQKKEKTLAMLEDRIRAMFGEQYVQCSLLAMLQSETHAPPHRDLLKLAAVLERRGVELGVARGDVAETSSRIRELVERNAADSEIFLSGVKASIEGDHIDDALDLLARAEEAGHGESSEIRLLRAKTYLRKGDLAAATKHLNRELEIHPSAEARLYLAMIELEKGDEDAALNAVSSIHEEDGGSDQTRHEIFHLTGVLLERRGLIAEARSSYLAAVKMMSGESAARYRAGVLGLESSIDDEGFVVDPAGVEESLALLEGVKDSDAICRVALARAARSSDVNEALHDLERAMKRTNGPDELRLQRARLNLLITNERLAEACVASEAMTQSLPESEVESHLAMIADLKKRNALKMVVQDGSKDSDGVGSWVDAASDCKHDGVIHQLFRFISGAKKSEPKLKKGDSPSLFLALGLAGGQRRKDGKLRAAVLTDGAQGVAAAEAKNVLMALQDGSSRELLDAIDSFDAAELTLPWSRLSLLSIVAAKAAGDGDSDVFETVISRAPGRFREHEKLRLLLDMLASGGSDTTRVLNLFCDLSARLSASDSNHDDEMLLRIRNKVTEIRETPSPAWASARLRVAGKRTRVHERSAERFWRQLHESGNGSDGEALHHLALMSLSKAHEAEMAGLDCSDIWREVHAIWGELVECSPFWLALTERLGGIDHQDVVSHLREKIAGWLLQAQVALAKRRLFSGDLSRAIEHARLAANSPLMKSCDPNIVQDMIFDALSGDLERHIHKGHLEEAMACIDHVIVADPDNPIARREMVLVAASALKRDLDVADSLSNPDPSMLQEICGMIGNVLLTAERSIRELAEAECSDPQIGRALVIGLRSLAFVASHKNHNATESSTLIDRAIAVAESCGLDSSSLCHQRSEIGLELVEETMANAPTASQQIQTGLDPVSMALEEVDRLIEIDPGNVKVIAQKARLLLVAHRDEEADALARDLFKDAQTKNVPTLVRSAVELMHQIQSEREKLRYESKMEMVERMCETDNWRAALDMFREAVVGRENEPDHLLKHADILIGLRKLDRAESLIDSLEDCESLESEWQLRRARLACIRHMADAGGDMLSAFELSERGNFEKALVIVDELLEIESKDGPLQFLAARCHENLDNAERALAHAKAARRCARGKDKSWVKTLVDVEMVK